MPEQAKALCGGEKTHIYSFDYLRLFAMCSVIFMHMASAQLRGERGLGWHAANILTSLAFTAVPLFFMMSGALLLSGSRTANLRLLWRKRIPRLLLPLLFWSLVHVVLFRFWGGKTTQESLDSLLAVPYKPVYGHLWYMYTLIALYAISPFLFHMTRAMDQPARRYLAWLIFGILALDAVRMLAPASAARYLQLDLASSLRFLNTNLFSFLLGWLLLRRKSDIANWKLIGAALVCAAVIIVGTWLRSQRAGAYDAALQSQTGGMEILLACLLFVLANQNLRKPLRLGLSLELVRLSMPIYLMHNLVKFCLWKVGVSSSRFLTLLPICALVLLICFLISKTLVSIPGLCWISTGIPWSEAQQSCSWQASLRRLRQKKAALQGYSGEAQ